MRHIAWCLVFVAALARAQAVPTVETDPVPSVGVARGVAVWIHPTTPSQSLVITADTADGLLTYGLDGHLVQQLADGVITQVDVRYGVLVAGHPTDLVATANQTTSGLAFYTVDPATRLLTTAGGFATVGVTPAGVALYNAPDSTLYAFAVGSFGGAGVVTQYALDPSSGHVVGSQVRTFSLSSPAEGAVADDLTGNLFVAEIAVGLWRFGAGAGAPSTGTLIDATDGGHLSAPVEGLALYQASNGGGYLLAANPGAGDWAVYGRQSSAFITAFGLGADGGLESPRGTTGIAVTNVPLGNTFPQGLFVAQDSFNDVGTNFKYVPWNAVAAGSGLIVDPTFNPRSPGSADGGTRSDAGGGGGGGGGIGHGVGDAPDSGPAGCTCDAVAWSPPWLLAGLAGLLAHRRRRKS